MGVGIRAIELYVPHIYVDQTELEAFDGVSAGKYTIGLGQHEMAVCSDREDVHSICLTVTHRLLEYHAIDKESIGCLIVGTESAIDKSKSIKSQLMQLFDDQRLFGADCVHACFGGTQALLHADDWLHGRRCHGRMALVVMGDIAVYEKGSARCTGGAGAIALLLGHDAPLVLDPQIGLSTRHSYDFFKPSTFNGGMYPIVNGEQSLQSYVEMLVDCYTEMRRSPDSGITSLSDVAFVCMHSPFTKLVQKAFARLCLEDQANDKWSGDRIDDGQGHEQGGDGDGARERRPWTSKANAEIVRNAIKSTKSAFDRQTSPTLDFARRCGNMYTPTLIATLMSAIVNHEEKDGERYLLYSYGSGAIACLLSVHYDGTQHQLYRKLRARATQIYKSLDDRRKVSPTEFNAMLETREKCGEYVPYTPTSPVDSSTLARDTFYLEGIDAGHQRSYKLYK